MGSLTGNFRWHSEFHSAYLRAQRDILVYLPPGYGQRRVRYPVLYLQDGQNLFDSDTAFAGREWRVDETAESLILAGEIQPLLIVAIYNAGVQRIDEYTLTRDPRVRRGGGGESYCRMLVDELKPFIDSEYSTRPDPASTGLGGSSLGALFALNAGLALPHVFGKLAVLSPSVWWHNRAIVKRVKSLEGKLPLRIWLDIGTAEGPAKTLRDARLLRDALVAKGWNQGADLCYFEAQGAGHNEDAWAARVAPMLRFLFPG